MSLDQLRAAVEPHVGDERVPGVVALVAHGDDVHVETLGKLGVARPPVKRDSLFRIASTTKPITAAATMALVDEGLIGLDDPIDRLLPEMGGRRVLVRPDGALTETVPANRAITIRDLLTFTFGFGMATEMFMSPTPWPVREATREFGLATLGEPDPAVQPDPDTWIARLGTLPLIAQPGERWLYNTGASVLGVLVARAANKPFAEVLRTRIFDPLGMRDTAFWTSHTDRLATAYVPTGNGLKVWDEPDGRWSRAPAFGDGAGGLVSTVDDLLAFARMLLRGGRPVLSPGSVRAMTTDQLTEAQKERGGLGPNFFATMSWGFCQAVYDTGAFGWDGGFGSSWRVDPIRDLTVIVLTQRLWESPELPLVHRDIQAAAYAATA
ncbi:MAG: beta-lactamase family protein [Solirubrobacterales bacterium]|nr:beta-lactamase family protein [Solirubrobacterales bacterium]